MQAYTERALHMLTTMPQDRLNDFFRTSPLGKTLVQVCAVGMMAQDQRDAKVREAHAGHETHH